MIHHGDLFNVLPTLEADSIDACVTDPPYELGFMGKHWDWSGVTNKPETWAAVLRVLKPGAHVVAFGGTRTFHRMTCAIEDAGFEIRDCLSWLYGQGFPKSLNLPGGLGTALKPAWEPIILARKPTAGTVAANVAAHGTGALNIDACRIGCDLSENDLARGRAPSKPSHTTYAQDSWTQNADNRRDYVAQDLGRWPANVLLDEDAAAALDEQSGERIVNAHGPNSGRAIWGACDPGHDSRCYSDIGGASRFFYVAKPSREERDYGCHSIAARTGGEATDRADGTAGLNSPRAGAGRNGGSRNVHPTVKPIALMRYLVKLVTPQGGTVLDPFTGSGTTGMACRYEHREFIGIEREAEYVTIAEARIAAVAPLFAVSSS